MSDDNVIRGPFQSVSGRFPPGSKVTRVTLPPKRGQAKPPGLLARLFRQPKPPGPQDAAPQPNFGPGPAPRAPAPRGLFKRMFRLP